MTGAEKVAAFLLAGDQAGEGATGGVAAPDAVEAVAVAEAAPAGAAQEGGDWELVGVNDDAASAEAAAAPAAPPVPP